MTIKSISIKNLAAFKDFATELPAVCLIEGAHAAGKSSLLRVIMYALGRRPLADKGSRSVQHDPSILHGNEEQGSAIITFDESGPLDTLRVVVKADSTERKVKTRGGKKWEDAGPFIDDITSALAYNPMQFRKLDPKERLEAFLRAVPVEISREEVIAAAGHEMPVPENPGLDTLNQIYDDIYKARTAENGAAELQASHAAQLSEGLPPETSDGTDWRSTATRLKSERDALKQAEQSMIVSLQARVSKIKDSAASLRLTQHASVDAGISAQLTAEDREVDILIRELEVRRQKFHDRLDAERLAGKGIADRAEMDVIEGAKQAALLELNGLRAANNPRIEALTIEIVQAEQRVADFERTQGSRAAAEKAKQATDAHRATSAQMTEALKRLTDLKATVAGRMSIKGVTIAASRPGQPVDICREEGGALIPFSIWNDADADSFALRMAVKFRGHCGLVCVDSMGNWNDARRNAVIERCKELAAAEGMQFLLGHATDGNLSVVNAEASGE